MILLSDYPDNTITRTTRINIGVRAAKFSKNFYSPDETRMPTFPHSKRLDFSVELDYQWLFISLRLFIHTKCKNKKKKKWNVHLRVNEMIHLTSEIS